MVKNYTLVILKPALKDKDKIKEKPALKKRVDALLDIVSENPYQNPPAYEKLAGNLQGLYSRRINRQHRLVYRVLEEEKVVMIISMWSHYTK
ncbi:MAG: Txe/YoeB family addiction module toxin [Coriobacteriia bacterium]|nr:Txe/YoeB family addiction module toxin [Coriobacteriia bacterium]